MPLPEFTNLEELEGLAKLKMEKSAFDYYSSGSDDEISRDENREAWKRLRLIPRTLVNVSHIDTSSHLLGTELEAIKKQSTKMFLRFCPRDCLSVLYVPQMRSSRPSITERKILLIANGADLQNWDTVVVQSLRKQDL